VPTSAPLLFDCDPTFFFAFLLFKNPKSPGGNDVLQTDKNREVEHALSSAHTYGSVSTMREVTTILLVSFFYDELSNAMAGKGSACRCQIQAAADGLELVE